MTTDKSPVHDAHMDELFDALGQPTGWRHPHWFRCPGCKGLGEIDLEQYQGRVSIVCECGWHGYRKTD